ncbi:hypothetical protein GGI12_001097 [Dipsacomyces acuminosporus]|nr:hypothetical protein GGI12_001097 [Dipsacomyces acuminosporus]
MVVPVNLAPDFFRWFYATPFFNGAMLFRYILSGAYPKLGLNLGVLLGEAALMSVLLFFTASFRQCTALTGITDIQGWYRGSLFFKSPIPYYKDVKAEEPQQRADSLEEAISAQASTLEVHVVDSIGANVSIKDGNLGV